MGRLNCGERRYKQYGKNTAVRYSGYQMFKPPLYIFTHELCLRYKSLLTNILILCLWATLAAWMLCICGRNVDVYSAYCSTLCLLPV